MIFEFYTWDYSKYIGTFSGKDWMDARRNASRETGIPVDDLMVSSTRETVYSKKANRIHDRILKYHET